MVSVCRGFIPAIQIPRVTSPQKSRFLSVGICEESFGPAVTMSVEPKPNKIQGGPWKASPLNKQTGAGKPAPVADRRLTRSDPTLILFCGTGPAFQFR